jgi:glutamate formiminotransferase/formiminotetrahydrofolate cyclodeaminase
MVPMPSPIVECIPNFSEARRPEVIDDIIGAITAAGGTILDRHSDTDHNRTVITYVGTPAAVEEAAFQGIRKAAELINLDRHTGSHPRIGATDVVPFVPLSAVSMEECVALARHLGERVGRELNIPVYLYEEAATQPDRVNLENLRHGQYEGLKVEIESNPGRKPDFGPLTLGSAGATVIGARQPLVAYNVFLNSNALSIAKAIARGLRHSSGGFRYVKALGMLVNGMAQVSMNLTNFRQTPVFRVVEAIRREADRYGTSIHHSELVGLIPQEALIDSAAWYLQLDDFKPDQILEQRLYSLASESGSMTGDAFLDRLASANTTPGGGSAAAHAAAMGAALVCMVARLTIGRKKYAAVEDQMKEILNQAERLRGELITAVEEDSTAFEGVMAAFRLSKNSPDQERVRAGAIEKATLHAAQVPFSVAQKSVSIMALAERVVCLGNSNAISDAGSASAMAHAALTSAGYNVRINVNNLADKTSGEPLLMQLHMLERKAMKLEKDIQKSILERGGFSLG